MEEKEIQTCVDGAVKDTLTICFLMEMWSEVVIWSFCHTWNHL